MKRDLFEESVFRLYCRKINISWKTLSIFSSIKVIETFGFQKFLLAIRARDLCREIKRAIWTSKNWERDISIIIMTLSITLAVAFITGWLISD